jgi:dTDP-3-amino-2,3,6-trideoxy-4-keto-D-glucose/dTDP-3-amino-3,4,6-trideoxy-alpha-D-glucose/dTDP-2,6-dideoxy-D-kanosamine transaminase
MVAMGAQLVPLNDLGRQNRSVAHEVAEAIRRVLESGWYILGPAVEEFEAMFAKYCGVEHCVGTANGTDALELALRICGVREGDQVATVANAGGYSTAAIRAVGGEPLYVDVEPRTLLLDPDHLRASVTPRLRTIVATHLYGRMVDMPRVLSVASTIGAAVIEDCAQAHGASLLGRRAGSWGTVGCFSFYPTKNLGAVGDAGAIITDSAVLAERACELRQYGWNGKYRSRVVGGRNSRLDELQAAVLLAKLPYLNGWNHRRRVIARAYTDALAELGLELPPLGGSEYVAHLYVVRAPDRANLRSCLAAFGIATDVHYPVADHRQEAHREQSWAARRLPVTECCCEDVLTLPCFPQLNDLEVDRVTSAVRAAVGRR